MKKSLKLTTIASLVILLTFLLSIVGNVYATEIFSITSISEEEKSETAEVNDLTFEGTAINSDIVFHKVGDYVKCKITIKNNEDKDYKIKAIKDNNENSFVSYDYSENVNTLINANESADIYITIKYANGNNDIENRFQNMNVDINITLGDPLEDYNENTVDETITINSKTGDSADNTISENPKTGDYVIIYMILFGVSLIAIITFVILRKKGKNSKKVLGLIIAIILVAPVMVNAAENGFVFNFSSKVALKDKLEVKYINASDIEETTTIDYGTSIDILNHDEKEYYDFVGWYDENGDKVETVTDDVKVIPQYEPNEFKITYNLNGGTADTVNTYTIENDTFTLVKPRRTGFIFTGWTGTNGEEPQKVVTIEKGSTGDRTYTANWVEGTVEIQESYVHPSNKEYSYFGIRTAGWVYTTQNITTYSWQYEVPCFIFEGAISRGRLGYSASGYVSYNNQNIVAAYIDTATKKRVWLGSGVDGNSVDGYYTLGYTIDEEDHELRIQIVSGEVVNFEQMY